MANMTSNLEPREQRRPGGNGGPQAEGGGTTGQGQAAGPGQQQSTAAKAASLATEAATRQVNKTRERIEDRITEQREQLSGRVRALGRALRGAGQVLEEDDLAAETLRYASDKIERVAGYVAELNPTGVAEDLRGIARSRPWWFYGGAFALGIVLGRFARSSEHGGMSEHEGMKGTGTLTPPRSETGMLPRNPERSGEQWP